MSKWDMYKAIPEADSDKWSQYHSSNFSTSQKQAPKAEAPQQTGSIDDFFKKMIRETLKQSLGQAGGQVSGALLPESLGGSKLGQSIGYGALPAVEQFPTGLKEGAQRAYAGLTGGQYKPSPVPDEYGAGFGRGAGQFITSQIPAAAAGTLGGLVGGVPGAIAGYGLGTAASTPGSLGERAEEGAIAAAIPTAGKLIGGTAKGIYRGINKYRLKPKEKALAQATADLMAKEQAEQNLKNIAGHQFGQQNPERLLMTAEDKARQLEEGQAIAQAHGTPEMQQMRPGEQSVAEQEGRFASVNEALKSLLGEGEAHTQKLSKQVVDAIEGQEVMRPHPKTGLPRKVREGGLREEIGKKYDALEESLPNVEIPGQVDMAAVEKEMKSAFGTKSNLSDEAKETFRKALAATHPSGKSKTINGKEFFRAYRSMMRQEGEQRSKAFSGLSPKDHDEWIERANNTKKIYEDMEGIINKYFPEDTLKKLHQINHEYSTKVAPLHENPMYQQMLKHGRYSGDVIEALSGTTKGNDILTNMIRGNPELARLTLGNKYAAKPEGLLKPDELVTPFANANPQISQLMQAQRAGQQGIETAKQQQPIIEQIMKNNALKQEIATMDKTAKDLRAAMDAKGISKEELARLKKQYDETLARRSSLRKSSRNILNKLTWGALIGGSSYLGSKAGSR